MANEVEEAGASEQAGAALIETGEVISILFDKVEVWMTGFVEMLPNLVVAAVVVSLAAIVARFGGRVFASATRRATHNDQLSNLARSTSRIAIFAGGVFVALGLLNLDKTVASLLAGVGVIGLALGFAFQDIAANFMSGIIMASRKPFDLGDLVNTHSTLGVVDRLTLRATVLENLDGQRVIIPNKEVLQNPIINFTRSGKRRVEVAVGVTYDTDLREARDVATKALEGLESRDPDKPVTAVYTAFGGSSIDLSLRFWISVGGEAQDYMEARSEAIVAVKDAFDDAGIGIPFPIRTLDFGGPGTLARALESVKGEGSDNAAA